MWYNEATVCCNHLETEKPCMVNDGVAARYFASAKPPIEKEGMVENPGTKEGDRKRKRQEGRRSLRCCNGQSNNRTYLTKNT